MDQRASVLLTAVRDLCGAARRVDMVRFEDEGRRAIEDNLLPLVRRMLEVALRVFGQALEAFDQAPADDGLDFAFGPGPGDAPAAESAPSGPDVAGTCFVARLEIQAALDSLRDTDGDELELAARCNRGRGVLVNAAIAAEAALCAVTGDSPKLVRRADLGESLVVRRAYALFLRRATQAGEPSPAELGPRLERAAEALDELVGGPGRVQLRVADRVALRRLQARLAEWLGRPAPRDFDDGMHLWRDIAGLAEIMQAINNRYELWDHDRDALTRALTLLRAAPQPDGRQWQEIQDQLARLLGRNPELDGLIEAGDTSRRERILELLEDSLATMAPPR